MGDSGWLSRRREFNHDLLKGKYIPDLDRWVNVLRGFVENEAFQEEFLASVFPRWEEIRAVALALGREFEDQMSPRCLLQLAPLSRLPRPVHAWLGELVHELWLRRYPIRGWTAGVISAVAAADATYNELRCLAGCCDSLDRTAELWPLFDAFRENCRAVADAVAQFPSDGRAT
jgi:hypothetical protein